GVPCLGELSRSRERVSYRSSSLKRNILVRNRPRPCRSMLRLWHALVEVVAARRACTAGTAVVSTTAAFTASAEQDQVTRHHFGHIFLLAAGLVVPRSGLQAAFDVNLAALLQILARNLGQALPEHHIVPLGAVLPLAALVLEALVGGDGDLSHGRALRRVFDLWIFPKISDQLNPVQTFSCHEVLLCRGSL